ncbi:hypothetical protein LLE49_04020 [Alicyclobacillus tolerans]|uniref:hypothetical protein n=1 Tax=Alicyclobacillus tolerans TaxID=90970 RepID=UPI001F430E10|nr:hypothetical protein [Alicyclobacillus tolerans]MCF8563904.1 hypothetical protein [Alicyclobacillus tolerans]
MKVFKVVWGLFVDDTRLVSVLILTLFISGVVSALHQAQLSAVLIWAGLIAALWVSVEHELKRKARSHKLFHK